MTATHVPHWEYQHHTARDESGRVAEFDPSGPVPERKNAGPHGDPERGPRPRAGYIGLQNHDERSVVHFKEVAVRPVTATGR